MEPQRTQRLTEGSPSSVLTWVNRNRIPEWVLLTGVCFFFFFWKLAAFGLIGADEPRYAQVAREMLERHDWITPTLGGAPWLEKPPLYYWQAMIAYRLLGVSDWAARLPSALDATVFVLVTYLLLRRLRPGTQLDGALILATCAGIVGYARAASMDMGLAATFALSMLAWFTWNESGEKKFLTLFYFLVALGTLAKGPVAPFFAAIIITIFAGIQRNWQALTRTLWLPGIAIFLAVALPWYFAAQLQNPQFFRVFILEHNLARFGTNLYHHPEPFWYYLPVTLLGWIPWTVIAIAALILCLRRGRDSNPLSVFLVIWIAVVVIFFSISQSKLPGYVLPAIPAGAVLAVQWLHARGAKKPHLALAGLHAFAACVLILPALMIPFSVTNPHAMWGREALRPLILETAAIWLLTSIVLWRVGWRMLRITTLAPAIIIVAVVLRTGAAPLNAKLSARPVVDAISHYDHKQLPVAIYLVPRETEFGLAFYRNEVVLRYEAGLVPDGEHFVIAAKDYPKGVANAAGRKPVFLGNLPEQKLDLYYVPAK